MLINPNTNRAVTERMAVIARQSAPPGVGIDTRTAGVGAPLISTADELATGGQVVVDMVDAERVTDYVGIIVAAFGDPGLDRLRRSCLVPATGIAEAAMWAAGAGGRRFAIVTTTPLLADEIEKRVVAYGHGASFAGLFLTIRSDAQLMNDDDKLGVALHEACTRAVDGGADAVVIGGGPLAHHTDQLQASIAATIINPVAAAVDLAVARCSRPPGETMSAAATLSEGDDWRR
jgi:Asp/Glu/hydantoin racemase